MPTVALAMVPAAASARENPAPIGFPVEMSMTAFLIIGGLLLLSIVLLFVFQKRFNSTRKELQDLVGELDHARQRLAETKKSLETTGQDLRDTAQRYQGILFDAQVGMFQMDLDGTTTYINAALEELSGLYPKKALKEGIQSAIHPDDRERFDREWKAFADDDKPLAVRFRFKPARGGHETHVLCRASKVLDRRKDAESYIGWISDVTPFHAEQLRQEAVTARYARFIDETIEGHYQLVCEKPIPLSNPPEKMAEAIMGGMVLASCNETFAAQYGSTPTALEGKHIDALDGGCGPFKNAESIRQLVEAEYKLLNLESIRQDPRGNRLVLLNQAVGLIEDGKLVGIWGSQRNISQEKREREALVSQARFMHRILDALPADVHVKDTRCRYLYASRKLADRTGVPQEEWVGKTIFEVMPATPRNHDKSAIEVMKTGKLVRTERPYETRKKTGWMETLQIPLVSDDGLVEGMVGLSIDITDRKAREEEAQHEILRNLRLRETELEKKREEFRARLEEHKQIERELKHREKNLLDHQRQLEEKLAARLAELESETDKRKKWEELISIKEDELRKVEEHSNARNKQLEEEITCRRRMEAELETSRTELEKQQKGIVSLIEEHGKEAAGLLEQKQKELSLESSARKQAESHLKKTEAHLQKAREQIKTLTQEHAVELEREIAERNSARKKLLRNTAELDELKQQFALRIEQETKQLKKELAQKQIREKALRQQEKKLEGRIKKLKETLQLKTKEHSEQIQAHEKAEALRKQAEEKLEQMNTRQNQMVEREAQKLSLNIAEIRLGEVKLRKQIGDLQQEKERLEKELREMHIAFEASQRNVESMIEQQTEALQKQLDRHKRNESTLQKKVKELQQATSTGEEHESPIEWPAKSKQKIAGAA